MPEPVGTLRALRCGSTTHDLATLLRGADPVHREFPSTAFLWEGGDARVLFDTGYAAEPWPATPAVRTYRRLVPPRVEVGDTVVERLGSAGVDPASVTHVVLSHAHPDHIGGLGSFPDAELVVTAPLAAILDARSPSPARLRAGVLRALLPTWFGAMRRTVIPRFDLRPTELAGLAAADLLGDGRLLVVSLPGHALGHAGLLVEGRALIAGDAAWGRDLLGREGDLRMLPRLVAADARAMADTAERLLRVERGGLRLLFSHDAYPENEDLLEGGRR